MYFDFNKAEGNGFVSVQPISVFSSVNLAEIQGFIHAFHILKTTSKQYFYIMINRLYTTAVSADSGL